MSRPDKILARLRGAVGGAMAMTASADPIDPGVWDDETEIPTDVTGPYLLACSPFNVNAALRYTEELERHVDEIQQAHQPLQFKIQFLHLFLRELSDWSTSLAQAARNLYVTGRPSRRTIELSFAMNDEDRMNILRASLGHMAHLEIPYVGEDAIRVSTLSVFESGRAKIHLHYQGGGLAVSMVHP